MIKRFELMVAFRYLRSKRKESFISVVSGFSLIGIALGVATLIVVMSVMNGYHKEFLRNILGIQGHLTAVSASGKFANFDEYESKIEKVEGVKFVAPIIVGQSMFISQRATLGGIVRGIDPEKLALKPLISEGVDLESLERFKKGEGILLGKDLAYSLKVMVGDTIKLVTTDTSSTLIGAIPRTKSYKVAGVFDVGLYQYNSTTIFMPLNEAQILYKYLPNQATEVEIMVENPEKIEALKAKIANVSGPNIRIIDWQRAQEKWLSALAVERNVMFLILTLIILVAVFNIISSLIMLVKDKSRGIAILRTMGATKNSIIKIFILCGTILGFTGTFFGVVLGVSFAMNVERIRIWLENMTGNKLFDPVIYFLTRLPSDLEMESVLLVCGMSLTFSLLATIYPAYRASKLMPAEVLRYE